MRSMNMIRIGHDDDEDGARIFGDFQNFRTDFFFQQAIFFEIFFCLERQAGSP